MDLAEQSLQALRKISQEHLTVCLRAGALMAVLSYLDFFFMEVRRVALSTAANMRKKLPSDAADFVMEAVPLCWRKYHDTKVLEHASVCWTRIAEAFASSLDKNKKNKMSEINVWEWHSAAHIASLTLNDENRKVWDACKEALPMFKLRLVWAESFERWINYDWLHKCWGLQSRRKPSQKT